MKIKDLNKKAIVLINSALKSLPDLHNWKKLSTVLGSDKNVFNWKDKLEEISNINQSYLQWNKANYSCLRVWTSGWELSPA